MSGTVQADFALWRLVCCGKSPDGRAAARRDSEFRGLSPLGPSGCIDWEVWAAASRPRRAGARPGPSPRLAPRAPGPWDGGLVLHRQEKASNVPSAVTN